MPAKPERIPHVVASPKGVGEGGGLTAALVRVPPL